MNLTDILQDRLVLISSQDLQKLAEALSNHFKSKEDHSEIKSQEKPVSQAEAMKRFNRSRQTFIKWRKKGILKGFLIGGRVYFHPEDLDALQQLQR